MGLPAVPAAGCPAAAGALGGTGLGAVCSAAGTVTGAVGSAVGSAVGPVVGVGVGSVLDSVSGWVTSGAVWLLGQIGGVLSTTTAIDLGAPWFRAHYATMAGLAGVVIVPLLLLGVVQSIYRQDVGMLLRSGLVHVPLAVLLTAVTVSLVQIGLAVTDSLCSAVSQGAGLDAGHFFASVTTSLAPAEAAAQPGGAPTFVLFLGGVAVVVGAVLVWMELLLRSAAVYVAVLFLPLALAGLAWPAISHWPRRLADTLAALVLSKLVIVAVLSLAAGALAGGTGSTPSGATGAGGGFASVLAGAALLLLAACAPWSLFRMLPFLEAGAVGHLEGLSRRAGRQGAAPVRALADVALRAAAAGSLATGVGAIGVIGPVVSGAAPGGEGSGRGPGVLSRFGGGGPSGGGARAGGGRAGRGDSGPHDDAPFRLVGPADAGVPRPWEPGGSIPWRTPDVEGDEMSAVILARYGMGPDAAGGGVPVGSTVGGVPTSAPDGPAGEVPVMPPGVTYERTLTRATGARYADHLGRDHLGPVLVSGRPRPESPAR